MRARRSGVVVAQAGKAFCAAATASSTLGLAGQRHRAGLLAGRRVEDGCEPAALAGDELAADEVLNLGRHGATSVVSVQ